MLAGLDKDFRALVNQLLADNPGAKLVAGGKHCRIEHPELPNLTITTSASDWRSIRNTRAQARRAGYVVR